MTVAVTASGTSRQRREANVIVVCPACGLTRVVSARTARRRTVCRLCSWGREPPPPIDFRSFWLDRLSDEEIAAAASFMANVPLRSEHVENVAQARRDLCHRALRSEGAARRLTPAR